MEFSETQKVNVLSIPLKDKALSFIESQKSLEEESVRSPRLF